MFKKTYRPQETQHNATTKSKAKLLTIRRIKKIHSFLCMTIHNPFVYGEFESPKWMGTLIELLREPKRCRSTRADIKAWLEQDCFKRIMHQLRQATGKLRLSPPISGSESPSPSLSTSSSESDAPMDLSVSGPSSAFIEESDSDSMSDIYVPNLDTVATMMGVVNEERREPQAEPPFLGYSLTRPDAMWSQGNADDMTANQNQSESAVGLSANSSGQQRDPEYATQREKTRNSSASTEDCMNPFKQGVVNAKKGLRPDHVSKETPLIAPWLFNREGMLMDSTGSENETFMEPNPTVRFVQVKTEVESDPETEYLDISYSRRVAVDQDVANVEPPQAPEYQSREGLDRLMSMEPCPYSHTGSSSQPNPEYQQVGGQYTMEQGEVLNCTINRQVPGSSGNIPIVAAAPITTNFEDTSAQTLPVPNENMSRQLPANFPRSTELLNDCNRVLTCMVDNVQHFEDFSNGWDVVYRAISLVQATLRNKQQ